ncbi:hypothetical protein PHPALM_27959 [Phytophthora palmivora]|uniref:Uncharacterized protein n=1 Tax=Phytophthora palmivora TaxID=4796 RepID=A0A2P4XBB3_9STRA|nr:hypothetical protein PHPALM_27959 [Phytophthora palmivora]
MTAVFDRSYEVGYLDEETKKEKKESANGLGGFDRDDFLVSMCSVNQFGPSTIDDVNVTGEYCSYSRESDDDEDSAFDEIGSDQEAYADEVESDPDFDDESDLFAQDDDAMRALSTAVGKYTINITAKKRERQLAAQVKDPKKTVEDLDGITEKLERQKPIREHEILEDGAVPRGTFGRHMIRERLRIVIPFHHFASISSEGITKDKVFNIRPVLQVMGKAFRRGYRLGPRVSFDGGTIPNRSQYNPIRVYNKDKPHKYGTKGR